MYNHFKVLYENFRYLTLEDFNPSLFKDGLHYPFLSVEDSGTWRIDFGRL